MAKRRLNKNLVIALTLFSFLVIIVLSVLMLKQLQKGDPERLMQLAQAHEEKGEWREAAVFYHRAWEKSGDWGYIVSWADMQLEEGKVALALQGWREALVHKPELIGAHRRQLETLLEIAHLHGRLDNWIAVQEAAEAMLAVEEATPEELAFAHHANGLALVNLESQAEENAARGMAELQEAVGLAPEAVDYAIDLASQHLLQGEVEEGELSFRRMLGKYAAPGAEASKVRTVYAKHLAGRREFEEARRYHRESVSLAGEDSRAQVEARLAQAEFLAQRWAQAQLDQPGDGAAEDIFAQAEAILKQCIAADPLAFEPYLQLAMLYKVAKRYADITDTCDRRLRQGFSRKGLAAGRNKLNAFRLMILASEGCMAQAVQASSPDEKARRDDLLQRAWGYVGDANAEYVDHPRVLSQSGRIKLAEGKDRDALDDLRRADEIYRSYDVVDWDNKLRLAKLHLSLNEPGAAKTVLEDVLDQAQGSRAIPFWILYAQVLLQNAERGGVIDFVSAGEIERVLAQVALLDPNNMEMKKIRAALLERQGKPEQAMPLTDSPTVRALLEARERAQNGDIDGAIEVLRAALAENPADPRLAGTTVNELLRLERADEARQVAEQALQAQPDDPYLRKLAVLTRQELSVGDRDRALLEIIEAEEDGYQRAWDLIDFHWRRRDFAKALPYFEEAEQHLIDRDTPQARVGAIAQHRALLKAKLVVAAQLDDQDAMMAARDSAARYNVDGAGGKSILGLYHMHRDEMGPAMIALQAALDAQPTDARLLTYMGQCLQSVGRMDEAWNYFDRAVRINPNEGPARKGLAVIAKRRGDTAAYKEEIRLCARLIPADPWVRGELLAGREQEDPERAIAEREEQLVENPDDSENLRRLAGLSETVGDLTKADDYYQRLIRLHPDDKNLIVTISRYYRRTGRSDRALETVARFVDSRTSGPEKAEARVLIAAHYLSEGDVDHAETTLLAAADTAETSEVCRSLGEFYLRTVQRPKEALVWFNRATELMREERSPELPRVLGLRIACLLHRSVGDLETARQYADEFMTEFPGEPQGLLWESEVYARTGQIDQAIESLTRYLARRPNEPYALFQRAQHYGALGRGGAAIEDLTTIKRVSPVALNLEPRVLLARLHFQAGRRNAWIEELESIVADAPESQSALEELVGAYIHEKRLVEADRMVTTQINRFSDEPDARWFFLRGRVSFELNKPDEALRDYQRGAEIERFSAESLTQVLEMYLRLARFYEGVDYYHQHSPNQNRTLTLLSQYARLLAGAGRKAEAVAAFREALTLAGGESVHAVGAVVNAVRAAFPTEPALREVIGLFETGPPGGGLARANERILAGLYRVVGRDDEAAIKLQRLQRTASTDLERGNLLMSQAELYQLSGDPERAVAAYDQVLQYAPDNWMVLNNIAYLYSDELGKYELALPYARRAVTIADTPATLDTLGWIYVGLGEYSSAIAELSKSVRLDPGAALTYFHLGEAYRRNRQFIEAADVLRRGREATQLADDRTLLVSINDALERVNRRDSTPQ